MARIYLSRRIQASCCLILECLKRELFLEEDVMNWVEKKVKERKSQ